MNVVLNHKSYIQQPPAAGSVSDLSLFLTPSCLLDINHTTGILFHFLRFSPQENGCYHLARTLLSTFKSDVSFYSS